MVRLDGKKVEQVKFCTSTKHWKGLLELGDVVILQQEYISNNFGKRFMEECVKLGDNKFVPIPVGSSKKLLMSLISSLRCDTAPQVKYRQRTMTAAYLAHWH